MVNPANEVGAFAAAETVALRSRAKLIAYLAARLGDVAAAEDSLSEAFLCVGVVGVARAGLPQ